MEYKIASNSQPDTDSIFVGSDLLSSLSDGLYGNPLEIFRELVQNAADAYEMTGCSQEKCIVEIHVNRNSRIAQFRDFALGMSPEEMTVNLLSVGKSVKKGHLLRGFRGIGRLAALGYCKRLIFRSRQSNSEKVMELIWDCQKMQKLVSEHPTEHLHSFINSVTIFQPCTKDEDFPDCFFDCVLEGVRRCANDVLLNPTAISDYLSETGPVPYHYEFTFRHQLQEILAPVNPFALQIYVNGNIEFLTRPHRNKILKPDGRLLSEVKGVKEINMPDALTATAEECIVGWFLDHDFPGALPTSAHVRGIRARIGNIQIGNEYIWDELYQESRFNLWHVGEIHIKTKFIWPNTRRDGLTVSSAVDNFTNALKVHTTKLSDICRKASAKRNKSKKPKQKFVAMGKDEYSKILLQLNITDSFPDRVILSIDSKKGTRDEQ